MSVERLDLAFKTIFETPGNTGAGVAEDMSVAIFDEIEDPEIMVTSVNGQIGAVSLDAADAGAQVALGYTPENVANKAAAGAAVSGTASADCTVIVRRVS